MCIGQTVWNPNFSIKVICALDCNLGFFRLAGTGMRGNHFFRKHRGTCKEISENV
jgi:hypothetical protein